MHILESARFLYQQGFFCVKRRKILILTFIGVYIYCICQNITMRLLLILFLLVLSLQSAATNRQVSIRFVPEYGSKPIVLGGQYYPMRGGDSIVFDVLKFYVSGIELYNGDELVYKEPGSYHLLNEEAGVMGINLSVPEGLRYNRVGFHIGIDSATNTSGALDGDLDPAMGMYWAWQSGYINLKLEGRSSICNTRNHEFSFHLGGYLAPGYALQQLVLPVTTDDIQVAIALDAFIQSIDLGKENSIMIPGKEAVMLATKMAHTFKVKE